MLEDSGTGHSSRSTNTLSLQDSRWAHGSHRRPKGFGKECYVAVSWGAPCVLMHTGGWVP